MAALEAALILVYLLARTGVGLGRSRSLNQLQAQLGGYSSFYVRMDASTFRWMKQYVHAKYLLYWASTSMAVVAHNDYLSFYCFPAAELPALIYRFHRSEIATFAGRTDLLNRISLTMTTRNGQLAKMRVTALGNFPTSRTTARRLIAQLEGWPQ